MPELPRIDKNPIKQMGTVIHEVLTGIHRVASDIDSSLKEIPYELPASKPSPPLPLDSITEQATLKYQLDKIISELQHLETDHLPEKGRIAGIACDCIAKAARDLRRHSLETIPIASRQGIDPKVFSDMAKTASELIEIGTREAVESSKYDDKYLEYAGVMSTYRKEINTLLSLQKESKSYRDECEGCPGIISLKEFTKQRKAR